MIKSKEFKPNEAEVSELIFLGLKELRNLKAEIYRSDISINLPEDFPFDKIPNGEEYDWKKGYYDIYFYQIISKKLPPLFRKEMNRNGFSL